jgi:hypothetical protein
MPCVHEETETEKAAALESVKKARESTKKKLDDVTALLCSLCESLDASGKLETAPTPVVEWWTTHSKADRERIEREHKETVEAYNKQLAKVKETEAKLKTIEQEKDQILSRKR